MMCEVYKLGDVSLALASTMFLLSYEALLYSATANSSSPQYNPFKVPVFKTNQLVEDDFTIISNSFFDFNFVFWIQISLGCIVLSYVGIHRFSF